MSPLFAGFGSSVSSQQPNKKKKKSKKVVTKKMESPEKIQKQWMNKLKRSYGGTTPEKIATGTERRIVNSLKSNTVSEPMQRAIVLKQLLQPFESKIIGLDNIETIRQRISSEELQEAITHRQELERHMKEHNITEQDIQTTIQRVTWNASADAKACRSKMGTMSSSIQSRVRNAAKYTFEATTTGNEDDDLVLDVGCGYGVFIPFLKSSGFKSKQIHGVDLSQEMIGHAINFYPDVNQYGKFQVMDFIKDDDLLEKEKYRAVVFCSSLHDLPDMKTALLKTKNTLLNRKKKEKGGSRIVIVHPQGASHVLEQSKQNSIMVPRGLPTKMELEEWLCNSDDGKGVKMKLIHEPASPGSQLENREGYLAVLETI